MDVFFHNVTKFPEVLYNGLGFMAVRVIEEEFVQNNIAKTM